MAGAAERRNPERTSRRQTRSMGVVEEVSEDHLEQSLEEELIKVIYSLSKMSGSCNLCLHLCKFVHIQGREANCSRHEPLTRCCIS